MSAVIPDDLDCPHCGLRAERRTCEDCGVSAMITDCGHERQPRPISADGGHDYCDACYERRLKASEGE